jgi:hypothetical protein
MFVPSGGDVRMPAGLDVRIHPNRRRRPLSPALNQARRFFHENLELRLRFSIEQQDACAPSSPGHPIIERFPDFITILANTGKNDAVPAHSDALQVFEFPARDNVKTTAQLG